MTYLFSKYLLLYGTTTLTSILAVVGICSHLVEIVANLEEPE